MKESKFPQILKSLREELGLTQEVIAAELEITGGAYSLYEAGKTAPTLKNLEKLAEIFDVTPNYLLGYETKEESNQVMIEKAFRSDNDTPNVYALSAQTLNTAKIINSLDKPHQLAIREIAEFYRFKENETDYNKYLRFLRLNKKDK